MRLRRVIVRELWEQDLIKELVWVCGSATGHDVYMMQDHLGTCQVPLSSLLSRSRCFTRPGACPVVKRGYSIQRPRRHQRGTNLSGQPTGRLLLSPPSNAFFSIIHLCLGGHEASFPTSAQTPPPLSTARPPEIDSREDSQASQSPRRDRLVAQPPR